MSIAFRVAPESPEDLLVKISSLAPENPFYTSAYVNVMRLRGFDPIIFLLEQDEQVVAGCTGFIKQGRLNRELEITSLPRIPDRKVFWSGLMRFCKDSKVSILEIHSFASSEAEIEITTGEVSRRTRYEYIIDLISHDIWQGLSSNHKRNINRALKSGLKMRCAKDIKACETHKRLIDLSMDRRRERGEIVNSESKAEDFFSFIENNAGEIYQAVSDDNVFSSILILRSQKGAYYQSAGTSPEGMKLGASQFLIHEIANLLKSQSLSIFNLGGTDQLDHGLQRFKAGFGARTVKLESANFYLGSKIKKKIGTALNILHHNPKQIFRSFINIEKYIIYSGEPKKVALSSSVKEMVLVKLTDEEITKLAAKNSYFIEHKNRVNRDGFNDAYGVFYNGKIAHISWMITANHDLNLKIRNVKLKEGEAEITHCSTLPEFRGKGIYVFAIKSLALLASNLKLNQIYMITNIKNIPSQKGIEKSGLIRQGKVVRFHLPLLERSFTFRGHRLQL